MLQSTDFQVPDEDEGADVRAVAQTMEKAYQAGKKIRDMPQPVCKVSGSAGSRIPRVQLMFTAYSKHVALPSELPGVGAGDPHLSVREEDIDLTFDCVSSRAGSTQDIPLQITVAFQARTGESEGQAVPAQDYLAITHSAALAVAKELGCVNDGGLPADAAGLPEPKATASPKASGSPSS
ncbi:hypothetical protein [Streptomyces sp. NBC_01408]|uniref:hypothetical protein n=1 Tax=Streptomyces sp. NBC_01408 TaxID=2903855 RepID=UPI0022582A3A|nr:hypothetical protein [Streptomyces sp. NBC_01408]MCX4693093.1 hypothetical protein [Streptomyces sp. NBC_01408]